MATAGVVAVAAAEVVVAEISFQSQSQFSVVADGKKRISFQSQSQFSVFNPGGHNEPVVEALHCNVSCISKNMVFNYVKGVINPTIPLF